MAEGACEGAREGVLGSGFVGAAAIDLGHMLDAFEEDDARAEGGEGRCFRCTLSEPDSEKSGVGMADFCAMEDGL